MKSLKFTILIFAITLGFISCSKKNDLVEEINKTEIQKKQIQQVIPEKYLDSLKKLGLVINTGITPINVEGSYAINPVILEATNIPKDISIGYRFSDAKLNLTKQTEDFGINLLGKNFLAVSDTSIVTAISGSGNDFTVYGKVKSTRDAKTAEFAIIFSGTMENKTIKNFRMGLICILNKNEATDNTFIKEGQGRLVVESDKLSTVITLNDYLAMSNKKQLLQLIGSGKSDLNIK